MSIMITPQLVDEALRAQDYSLATELLAADKQTPSLSDENRLQLMYIRLNSLTVEAVNSLLSQSILVAYRLPDYSLADKLKDFVEQYDYVPDAVALCGQIPALLTNSQELLGEQPVLLGDKKVPPTISNWLNHYALHSTSRDSYDVLAVMKYFNTNPDLKVLTQPQKTILKDLIRLQDYCNEVVKMWELLPENMEAQDLASLQASLGVDANGDPIEEAGEDQSYQEPVETVEVESPTFKIPLQKNLDLGTAKRGGLVFDQPTNVNLDDEMKSQAERKRNESAIQAKLEALKQKQGINDKEN